MRAGHRHRRPLVLHLRRQSIGEFAELPRPRNPHREEPALELLEWIRNLLRADDRSETGTIHPDVVLECPSERRIGESPSRSLFLQQRRPSLHAENDRWVPFVERKKDAVL